MKGIILAGDSGNKLHPLTCGIPKQLLPVYDRPMIYYPIETLVEAGIRDILIITSPHYTDNFVSALGDGSSFGAHFTYARQALPEGSAQAFTIGEDFIANDSACLITGDCIILGKDRANKIGKAIRAAKNSGQATIFIIRDNDPSQYGVVKLDAAGRAENLDGQYEGQNKYSIIGLYVFPKGVADYAKVIEKSERGRYEVTSLQKRFLEENKLQVQKLGDDFVWLDTNTVENLLRASIYIQKNK